MSKSVSQLLLDFPKRTDFSGEAFMPLACNQPALAAMAALGKGECLVVYGASGVGKSHLLQMWAVQNGATYCEADKVSDDLPLNNLWAIDDLQNGDAKAQERLFHLFNYIKNDSGKLVVACDQPVAQMEGLLPDLQSRLLTGAQVEITNPSEADLRVLMLKWATDRQLELGANVAEYLLKYAERSPRALEVLLTKLDDLSLSQKRKITIHLAKQIIEDNEGKNQPSLLNY